MAGLHDNLIAVLTGFVVGFFLSVPVGPVNLTIMNEGARRGLLWASLIGLGAVVMEVIYCALAFTGIARFFEHRAIKGVMEIFTFGFFVVLGIKFLRVHHIKDIEPKEQKFIKLNPHSAFMIGMVRVAGNLGVFLFWIVLATQFHARGFVQRTLAGSISCVAGVAGGTGLWFWGLSYYVSKGHGKITEPTLLKMEHISGYLMLALGLGQGVHILWQLAHHTL